jgi:hypothetical protein
MLIVTKINNMFKLKLKITEQKNTKKISFKAKRILTGKFCFRNKYDEEFLVLGSKNWLTLDKNNIEENVILNIKVIKSHARKIGSTLDYPLKDLLINLDHDELYEILQNKIEK